MTNTRTRTLSPAQREALADDMIGDMPVKVAPANPMQIIETASSSFRFNGTYAEAREWVHVNAPGSTILTVRS